MIRWFYAVLFACALLGFCPVSGQNVLTKMYVDSPNTFPYHVAADKLGNVYCIMTSLRANIVEIEGVEIPDSLSQDWTRLQLAKFDPQGRKLWARTIGRGATDGIVSVDRDDNPVIWANVTLDSGLLAKLDKDGNEIWIRYEEDVENRVYDLFDMSIAFDQNNDIIVFADKTQYRKWPIDFDSLQDNGLMLVKYSKDGERLWQRKAVDYLKVFPSRGDPADVLGVAVDRWGNIFIRGYCTEEFFVNGVPLGSYFVAKFTAEGQFLWLNEIFERPNRHDGSPDEPVRISNFVLDDEGNLYIVGVNFRMDGGSFLKCLDGNGEELWSKGGRFGSYHISRDHDGNLLVSGEAYHEGVFYQNFHSMGRSSVLRLRPNGDFIEGWTLDAHDSYIRATIAGTGENLYTTGVVFGRAPIGCDSVTSKYTTALFVVKYDKFPNSQIVSIVGPEEICEGGEVTLTCSYVESTSSYEWDLPYDVYPVSGTSTTQWNSITVVTGRFSHEQPIRVAVERECHVYYTPPYVIRLATPLQGPIVLEGSDTVCAGDQAVPYKIISMPESPKKFGWKYPVDSDSVSTNVRELLVNYSTAFKSGSLWYEASNACGPVASDTIKVKTFITPGKPLITGEHEVCQGTNEAKWNVENLLGAESFIWSTPPALIPNPLHPLNTEELVAQVFPQFVGGEIIVMAVGRCRNSEPSEAFRIDVPPPPGPVSDILGPEKICDEQVTFTSAAPNSKEFFWLVPEQFIGSGIVTTVVPKIELSVKDYGQGSISLFAKNRCGVSSDTVVMDVQTFKVYDTPVIQAETCSTTLSIEEAEGIEWYKDGQLVAADVSQLTLLDSGAYHVRIGNYCGEQRSEPRMIYPVIPEKIKTPNVITSNGDIYNEHFQIDKSLVSLAALHVYDRSGNLVFNSGAYDNTWNAAANPPGVYYAVISHPCLPRPMKGTINVIK